MSSLSSNSNETNDDSISLQASLNASKLKSTDMNPPQSLKNKYDASFDHNDREAKGLKLESNHIDIADSSSSASSSNNTQLAGESSQIRKPMKKQPSSTNLMRDRNPSFKAVRAIDYEKSASFSDDQSTKSTQPIPRLVTQYSHDSCGKKRARTMYAPVQQNTYGPKATLKKVTEDYLVLIQDPLSQQLSWTKPPLFVLVIKKLCNTLFEPFVNLIKYLVFNHNMIVYVEENEFDHELMKADEQIQNLLTPTGANRKYAKPSLRKFTPATALSKASNDTQSSLCKLNNQTENLANKIDLIVSLGGDGTLLHASTLFQKSCPPILSLNMGSLGFLCPFDFENYREYIDGVIKGNVPLLLRNRLSCKLEKTPDPESSLIDPSQSPTLITDTNSAPEIPVTTEWLSLNEVVVDRGPSPFLSNLDLYVNDFLITTVQGDGLIISSPTGSTAYAMAAGASMCHPSVPSIMIVPICPHSLSFRPIVVPAGVELRIALSSDARHTAWYSIDGRNSGELKKGYHLTITTSTYPLPSICRSDQMNDWFEGLGVCLHWNQRQKQLPLNSCYLNTQSSSLSSKSSSTSSLHHVANGFNNSQELSSSSSSSSTTNGGNVQTNQNETGNDQVGLKVQNKMTREPSVEFHLDDEPKSASKLRIPSSSNLVARETTK